MDLSFGAGAAIAPRKTCCCPQMRRISQSVDALEAAAVALHGSTVSPALVAQARQLIKTV